VGLTGLAVVFLLVLLATVIASGSRDSSANSAAQATTNQQPNEPLSELGVAPRDSANASGNAAEPSK
jgi:hypothetical protein